MMTLLDPNDCAALADLLCIRDKDGRPALRIGLLATMFLAEPWTRPVREAVTNAAESYLSAFRPFLRWAQHPKTSHIHAIAKGKVPSLRDWLPQHEDGKAWHFGFHGGETSEATGEFQVCGLGPEDYHKGEVGYFQVYLPLTWFSDQPGTFQDFVLSFAKRLRPVSGYAGIGILETLNVYAQESFQDTVKQIAERFPGLEMDNPVVTSIHTDKGIKGVNWLTILGDQWAQAIGGLDYLRIRLGEDFKLTPYEGGLMIQAGPKPQIGDAAADRWPKHYVTLAKVLKPIQIKDHYPFHFGAQGGPPRMDHAASKAWIFRFDGK
ncbi:MAG: type VI immunity family protein [Byssovorax sp.]